MNKTTASCSCGQLKLEYDGVVTKSSICHCYECQKRTGSAFGVQGRLEKKKVKIIGNRSVYERVGDEGHKIKFEFCPNCGTTVFWQIDHPDFEEFVIAAFGALDSHDIPDPVFSVYGARKQSWLDLPKSIVDHLD